MLRLVGGLMAVLGLWTLVWLPLVPSESAAAEPQEQVLGDPDAPVTIIEYASLTCPHCAQFHKEVLPQLKERYIAPGKVRLIYRDFPLDQTRAGCGRRWPTAPGPSATSASSTCCSRPRATGRVPTIRSRR